MQAGYVAAFPVGVAASPAASSFGTGEGSDAAGPSRASVYCKGDGRCWLLLRVCISLHNSI
jgi:hypothetical protein